MKMDSNSYKGNARWVAAERGPRTAGGDPVNPEPGVGTTAQNKTDRRRDAAPASRSWRLRRLALGLVAVGLAATGCSTDGSGEDPGETSASETSASETSASSTPASETPASPGTGDPATGGGSAGAASGASGSATEGASGGSGAAPTSAVEWSQAKDSLLRLSSASQIVSFRGGRVSASELEGVTDTAPVRTPMDLIVQRSVDDKLTERARNQVRKIVASASGERGSVPRVDPFWVDRTEAGDVAIYAIVDNPGDTKIKDLEVTAMLSAGSATEQEPVAIGSSSFVLPAEEVPALEPNSAAFVILILGEDKLDDPEADLDGITVRFDLRFSQQ